MTPLRTTLLRSAACLAFLIPAVAAQAQPAAPPSRGQLLYSTHCIECHNTQMHWRANKQARDWATLRLQVVRWQATAGLSWSDADIDEVVRHLNDTIYHYPQPASRASRD